MQVIDKITTYIYTVTDRNPFTNVYGLARSLLGLGTLLTLFFNNTSVLFRPIAGIDEAPVCVGLAGYSYFCVTQPFMSLETARWIAVFILLIVAIGWRPRITGILHWWISCSFMASSTLVDGGDQVTAVLTFLLLPICLIDDRRWHWTNPSNNESEISITLRVKRLFAWVTFWVVRVQIAIIYLNAGVAKFKIEEWTNGTAIYYWSLNPALGLADWTKPIFAPILDNPVVLTLATFSVIVLEITLFSALFWNKNNWKWLLYVGISFHFMIIVVHGLVTFFLAMTTALILFLRPKEQIFLRLNRKVAIKTMILSKFPKLSSAR